MKTIQRSLISVTAVALLAAPLLLPAQTATTPSHAARPAVHRHPVAPQTGRKATGSDAIKLPASIPVANGELRTAYALRYIDIRVGTGAPALPGMLYSVHYTGWLYDGTKFDSSVGRGAPFQFFQGRRQVIEGWDTGFDGMKVGGKRRIFVPYQLAYGDAGRAPIPAKANLIFDMELIDVKDANAPAPTQP